MAEEILDAVRSKYGAVAQSTLSSNDDGVKAVAEAFGYSADELTSIPAEANMGLLYHPQDRILNEDNGASSIS
jgi:arsenite methyltransferase